jgi:hypothetical protein
MKAADLQEAIRMAAQIAMTPPQPGCTVSAQVQALYFLGALKGALMHLDPQLAELVSEIGIHDLVGPTAKGK